MTTIQDNEGFEGIEVETPVGRFRAGRESDGWNDDADYRAARKRVRRNMAFYRHVWTYLSVIGLLFVLDIATGGGWWVHWIALVWGVILVLHFLNVFVFDSLLGRDAERRMIERELRKRESRGH
jgi:hypothetical protein